MNKSRICSFVVSVMSAISILSSARLGADDAGKRILATTFPVHQIVRNVAKDSGAELSLLLPAQLGCPHDYALSPQDMMKLAKADILVINGLGMEEFLGAPVEKANAKIIIVDSSAGIKDTLEYSDSHADAGHGHGDAAFEWAGVFALKAGGYRLTFSKKGGGYADPSMKLLLLPGEGNGLDAIEMLESSANELLKKDGAAIEAGGRIRVGETNLLKFSGQADKTTFGLTVEKAGTYVLFTEHMPGEFEDGEHFFKTAEGADMEASKEKPEHADHHHHHHCHSGVNPHLFASPRMAAKMAMNIADGLAKADPANAGIYIKNGKEYSGRLERLADEMADAVKKLKNRKIVQPHGIFDYLARDIGIEIIATMQAHGQEPSAAETLQLIKKIKDEKPGAIVSEPQYPDKMPKTISKETGVPHIRLDPVASGPEDAALDHYERTMRENMKILEKSIGKCKNSALSSQTRCIRAIPSRFCILYM